MIENYRRAKAYLKKIDAGIYKDVLHDSYLTYYRRTGNNLFELDNHRQVILVVKNQYFDTLRKRMYKKDGVRFPLQYCEFDNHTVTTVTPEDILIGADAYETIRQRTETFDSPEMALTILQLRLDGYDTQEISDRLNLSIPQVRRYTQNLRKDRVGRNKKCLKRKTNK